MSRSPKPADTIYLMEGGPLPGEGQTCDAQLLRTKIRIYSLFFPRILVSATDYVHSDLLHRAVEEPLWDKGGTVAMALPNDVGSPDGYFDTRFDQEKRYLLFQGKRLEVWHGRTSHDNFAQSCLESPC